MVPSRIRGARRLRWHMLTLLFALGLSALATALPASPPAIAAASGWQAAAAPGWLRPLPPVLLADGRLLAAGGATNEYLSKLSALYDPATDAWSATADLTTYRDQATLTPLPDGGVLAVGGVVASGSFGVTSTERFDPATKTWRPAAPLRHGRYSQKATILTDGRVFVMGGVVGGASPSSPAKNVNEVEIYDPSADRWQDVAMPEGSFVTGQIALLADGTVLAVSVENTVHRALRYDPRADCWTTMAAPRLAHGRFTLTVLQDGRVLLLGGGAGGAELFDPTTNAWTTAASPITARTEHTATLLPSGEVLVTGGTQPGGTATSATERYDPRTNNWRADAPLLSARVGHSAILVLDSVYVVGFSRSAERYSIDTTDSRCFAETGRCTQGRFLAYWEAHGGLAVNGYPLSAPFAEQLEDGRVYLVQYFERTRMEYHPENAAPNDVLLGQFGRRIHPADPPAPRAPGTSYFAETGHNLGGSFRTYWEANGGLAQFGFPISEEIEETLEDGKTYTVQYFERARFEYHPENAKPYDVLLGQFGRRILAGR